MCPRSRNSRYIGCLLKRNNQDLWWYHYYWNYIRKHKNHKLQVYYRDTKQRYRCGSNHKDTLDFSIAGSGIDYKYFKTNMPLITVLLLFFDIRTPSLPLISCHVPPLHPISSTLSELSDFKKGHNASIEFMINESKVKHDDQ